MRRLRSIQLLMVCLILTACAARGNPNLTPGTARDLNLVFQLDQANKDYLTFFTDVGEARRAGILSAPQVTALNTFGNAVKTALENANATMKTYQAVKNEDTRNRALGFLKQANDGLAQLLARRSTMLMGGAQ